MNTDLGNNKSQYNNEFCELSLESFFGILNFFTYCINYKKWNDDLYIWKGIKYISIVLYNFWNYWYLECQIRILILSILCGVKTE